MVGLGLSLPRARQKAEQIKRRTETQLETCRFESLTRRSRLEYEVLARGQLLGPAQLSTREFLLHESRNDPELGAGEQEYTAQLLTGAVASWWDFQDCLLPALIRPDEVVELHDGLLCLYPRWQGRTVRNLQMGEPIRWKDFPSLLRPLADLLCYAVDRGHRSVLLDPLQTPLDGQGRPGLLAGCLGREKTRQPIPRYFQLLSAALRKGGPPNEALARALQNSGPSQFREATERYFLTCESDV